MTELIVVLGGPAFTLLLLLLWMAVRRRRDRRLLPRVPAKAAGRKIRPGAAADPVRDDKAGQAAPAKAGDGALVQAPGAWLLGLATHRGPVRPRNEDAGCAFTVGKHQVLVLADGVGGMPHGADASRAAVRAAERAIRQAWRVTPHGQEPLPRMMLSHAFAAAAARLASSGIARGFTSVAAGLRTTLIVVIGTADHFHFGHVGDGGINLVRGDGSAKSLFVPHKADPEVQNVLSASLGPVPQGAAVFGATERRRSDLLVAATDGVTDRVAPAFYGRTLLRQAARHAGDLTRTAQAVLERLSQHRDDGGLFAFDDNMTLGLMGDGRAPIDPAPAPRTLAREVA
jgi:serine/threonine protein phosphatase PrpC